MPKLTEPPLHVHMAFSTIVVPTHRLPPHLLARIITFIPCNGGQACGCYDSMALCHSTGNMFLLDSTDEPTCDLQRTLMAVGTAPMRAALKLVRRRSPRTCETHGDDRRVMLAAAIYGYRDEVVMYSSERLMDDKSFVLEASTHYPYMLEYVSARLRDDTDVVIPIVGIHGHLLEFASSRLRDDRDTVMSAIAAVCDCGESSPLEFASPRLQDNREVAMASARRYHTSEYMSGRILDDEVVMLALGTLENASLRLRNKRDFVMTVAAASGDVFPHISDHLCDDKEVVMAILNNTIKHKLLEHVSPRLRRDRDVVMASLRSERYELPFVGYDQHTGTATDTGDKFIPPHFRDDEGVMLRAVFYHDKMAMSFASRRLVRSKDFSLAVVRQRCGMLRYVPMPFRDDYDVVLAAVAGNHGRRDLEYASPRLLNNRDIVLSAFESPDDGGLSYGSLRYASIRIRNDKDIALKAAEGNRGDVLQYVSLRLRDDRDVVMKAACEVTNYGHVLQYASPRLRDDREVVMKVVAVHGSTALRYASMRLRRVKKNGGWREGVFTYS